MYYIIIDRCIKDSTVDHMNKKVEKLKNVVSQVL